VRCSSTLKWMRRSMEVRCSVHDPTAPFPLSLSLMRADSLMHTCSFSVVAAPSLSERHGCSLHNAHCTFRYDEDDRKLCPPPLTINSCHPHPTPGASNKTMNIGCILHFKRWCDARCNKEAQHKWPPY
jgi:hypothetical protein